MRQKTVLITGASDGIGLALARLLQGNGVRVVGVGRRPPMKVEGDPALRGDYCRVDLTQPFAAAVVAEFLRWRGIDALDLLIHCAGVGSYGPVEAQTAGEIDALLDTNLHAPVALTHALLPTLVRVSGRVVFIGSVAAALPVPDYAVYGATKAALEGFARSLRVELRGRVSVQVIHPGATRTGMHAKVGAPLERIGWSHFPPPERIARQIVRAIEEGTPRTTLGLRNRLLHFAGRHLSVVVERVAGGRQPLAAERHLAPSPRIPHPASRTKRHCVVTGGADGIGRAVAERYARAGYTVTIIDRDAERAAEVCQTIRAAGGVAGSIRANLAQGEEMIELLRQLAALPPADVCVHSAGISAVGRFASAELTRQQAVLDVNLRAPVQLTAGMLRARLLAPGATLVYIASLSVFTGYPGAAVYAASKDGLAAYARSLRAALAGRGVHVLTVYPGPTRTAHARRYSPDNRREGRRMPPERLAELLYAAVARSNTALIPGPANRLIATLGRLAPALTEELMRRTILDRLPQPVTTPSHAPAQLEYHGKIGGVPAGRESASWATRATRSCGSKQGAFMNDTHPETSSDKLSYLRDTDIFRDLEHAEVEALGKRAPMQRVPAGTVFFSPEQAAEVLFILKEGQVRLYHLSPEGKALTTAVLEPGTIFGEMAMLGQRLHQSYAEAMSPCLLCLMSREDVKRMLLSDPRVATRIAEILGQRLISAEQRLSDFAFKNLPQRLASLLLQLGRPPKARLFRAVSGPSEVQFTHEALAEMVGTYRETATKILNEFRAQGLIELKRGCVVLVDEPRLRALSEQGV